MTWNRAGVAPQFQLDLARMGQMLLIPDPTPLAEISRNCQPEAAWRVSDAIEDNVLYAGKPNLQQRLRNYRIANPDRMPGVTCGCCENGPNRVSVLSWRICRPQTQSKLLRSLKPRFNRAGVWSQN
jgi:hypothetical protein